MLVAVGNERASGLYSRTKYHCAPRRSLYDEETGAIGELAI